MFEISVSQSSQEPREIIHIALCVVALQIDMVCASTLRNVLATRETTCTAIAHCNCCWVIT